MKVACGGFHTLAVVRHDPREAGEDAARRGVRQWAKPKPELTVGELTQSFCNEVLHIYTSSGLHCRNCCTVSYIRPLQRVPWASSCVTYACGRAFSGSQLLHSVIPSHRSNVCRGIKL